MRINKSNPLWSFTAGAALGGVLLAVLWGILRVSDWASDDLLSRIDQLNIRQEAETTLWLASIAFAALTLIGIGVPLLAFLRQTRRTEESERRALFLAHHEPMTGLLNRPRFVEALDTLLAERDGRALTAVLCIDLDGLREINHLIGHEVGDDVLVRVSRSLERLTGHRDLLARLGGDKFAIARQASSIPDVKQFAEEVLKAIGAPQDIRGEEITLSAQIGIALHPGDGDSALKLLKAAGLALDRARVRHENCYVFFERTLEAELQRRRELEQQIRDTLAEEAFDLHFQPRFDAAKERLTGFEALLRMLDGKGSFVSPAIFIPVAEEIGLIVEIGNWVLKRACALAVNWPGHLTVAVNLSPAQFKAGGVHRAVQQALAESGLPAQRLELEITEGLILNDDAAIMSELADLKALGVSIVMDDFGTGYSSLSYLWKFPFDKIKIDRSFMRALGSEDRQVVDILRAIMSLSRALRMRVTAEGVETEFQAAFLKNLGCDEVQGYFFGRPMPIDEAAIVIMRDIQLAQELRAPHNDVSSRLAAG